MKSNVKNQDGCVSHFEIEIPQEDVQRILEEVYTEIEKTASIPGFRVGKAPRDLVKKVHAEKARDETLKRLIVEGYSNALKKHDITPLGSPEVTDVKFEEGKLLFFKVKIDRRPRFKLKEYKGIHVEKQLIAIKEEDVAKGLEGLREYAARYVTLNDKALDYQYYAVCDFEYTVDGKATRRNDMLFLMDKQSLLPDVVKNMVGMKTGEERTFGVTFPSTFPDKQLQGKKADYKIKVKEIQEKQLPDLSDELAKDLGMDNLQTLKEKVKEELTKRMESTIRDGMKNQLLRYLADGNIFDVPASMVDSQIAYLVEDAKERLTAKGVKKEDLDKKTGELEGKFREEAIRSVRLSFILNEIGSSEKIDVSEKELEDTLHSIAERTGQSPGKVKEHYQKEGLVDHLAFKLREDKVVEFLLQEARVIEKKAS